MKTSISSHFATPLKCLLLPVALVSLQFAASAQSLPQPTHVVVIMDENRSYSDIIGSPSAPYLNSLINSPDSHVAVLTDMHAETHPTDENYLDLFSGSNQGRVGNGVVPGYDWNQPDYPVTPYHPLTTPNLGASLFAHNYTFASYEEGLPFVGANPTQHGPDSYYTNNNIVSPFDGSITSGNTYMGENVARFWMTDNPDPVNNHTIPNTIAQPFTNFPVNDFSQLPTISFVHSTENNSMHGGYFSPDSQNIVNGDAWIKTNLDSLPMGDAE